MNGMVQHWRNRQIQRTTISLFLSYHPPCSPQDTHQDKEGQKPGSDTIPRRDLARVRSQRHDVPPCPSGRITLTRPTGGIRDGPVDLRNQIRLDDFHRRHLFTDSRAAVPGRLGPFQTTRCPAFAGALTGGGDGGSPQSTHDSFRREGRHLRRLRHPS